jgi:hypothetical protein
LIALLAICRKVIILDLKETDASQTFALAAAILALGFVYWLIRNSDQRPVSGLKGRVPTGCGGSCPQPVHCRPFVGQGIRLKS